jgi:hypothetical protein
MGFYFYFLLSLLISFSGRGTYLKFKPGKTPNKRNLKFIYSVGQSWKLNTQCEKSLKHTEILVLSKEKLPLLKNTYNQKSKKRSMPNEY